jgi:hypothetical protein
VARASSADRRISTGALAIQAPPAAFRVVIGGNADGHDLPFRLVEQPELVKVVIQPAHRVLDGNVQIPEGVALGNLNAAPHEWVGPSEDDEELVHEGRPALLATRATGCCKFGQLTISSRRIGPTFKCQIPVRWQEPSVAAPARSGVALCRRAPISYSRIG